MQRIFIYYNFLKWYIDRIFCGCWRLLSRCYIVYIWTTSQSIVAPLRQVFLLILSITSSSAFLIISCSLFRAISAILWYLRSSVFFLIASAWVEILYRYLFYKYNYIREIALSWPLYLRFDFPCMYLGFGFPMENFSM